MNWNLEKFPNISAFFEVKKWSTTFWKSRDLVVFGVKCFNCDTKIIMFTKYPAWNKDDIEVVPCLLGHPVSKCMEYKTCFVSKSKILCK